MFTIKPFYLKNNYRNGAQKGIVRLKVVCAMPKTISRCEGKKSFISTIVY